MKVPTRQPPSPTNGAADGNTLPGCTASGTFWFADIESDSNASTTTGSITAALYSCTGKTLLSVRPGDVKLARNTIIRGDKTAPLLSLSPSVSYTTSIGVRMPGSLAKFPEGFLIKPSPDDAVAS